VVYAGGGSIMREGKVKRIDYRAKPSWWVDVWLEGGIMLQPDRLAVVEKGPMEEGMAMTKEWRP
jgi:hypothetical protein